MNGMTLSNAICRLEAMERDARCDAAAYADQGVVSQSMYQDGRAAGIREALALLRAADTEARAKYPDTRDRMTSPWTKENWEAKMNSDLY